MQLHGRSGAALARLDQVAAAGPVLAGRAYVLPEGDAPQALPPDVLVQRVPLEHGLFMVAVGPPAEIAALDQVLAARKARTIALPADLPADPEALDRYLAARRNDITQREQAARGELDQLCRQHGLPAAIGAAAARLIL
jgi:hypothetical protein